MAKYKYKGDPNLMIDENFKLKEFEILGEGAFGLVVKCLDLTKQRFYALKIM